MNRLNDRFDTHTWIDLAGADYLSDNDYFSMIIFGAITSPKVSKRWLIQGDQNKEAEVGKQHNGKQDVGTNCSWQLLNTGKLEFRCQKD